MGAADQRKRLESAGRTVIVYEEIVSSGAQQNRVASGGGARGAQRKPYVLENRASGRFSMCYATSRPLDDGTMRPHGAFKTAGGAREFATAANAGEVITHSVAEQRARAAYKRQWDELNTDDDES